MKNEIINNCSNNTQINNTMEVKTMKQISSKQPEALRVSDDQIDAYIANAKLEG